MVEDMLAASGHHRRPPDDQDMSGEVRSPRGGLTTPALEFTLKIRGISRRPREASAQRSRPNSPLSGGGRHAVNNRNHRTATLPSRRPARRTDNHRCAYRRRLRCRPAPAAGFHSPRLQDRRRAGQASSPDVRSSSFARKDRSFRKASLPGCATRASPPNSSKAGSKPGATPKGF